MNRNSLVVVADAARARIFRLASGDAPRAPVALVELDSLVHPEVRLRQSERYSGSFSASGRAGKEGSGHGLDDHRDRHDAEDRRRFARYIAEATAERARDLAGNPVIVLASHALHGALVAELEQQLPREIYVRSEIADLTELSPSQLLSALEARGVFQP